MKVLSMAISLIVSGLTLAGVGGEGDEVRELAWRAGASAFPGKLGECASYGVLADKHLKPVFADFIDRFSCILRPEKCELKSRENSGLREGYHKKESKHEISGKTVDTSSRNPYSLAQRRPPEWVV